MIMLAKARIINYNRNCSFIVLATIIMIVNYDRHLYIVQVTGDTIARVAYSKKYKIHLTQLDETEVGLSNKGSCLAPALGVTKFIIVKDVSLVTLCCVT